MQTASEEIRLSLSPLYLWEALEKKMRVGADVPRTVVFVGIEAGGNFVPTGTGWVVMLPYEDVGATFLVTARHVLDDIQGDAFYIRVNRKNGDAESRKISKEYLIVPDDRRFDLAVVPIPADSSIYDIFPIIIDSKQWSAHVAALTVGPLAAGEEVCIVGLYTTYYGHKRNIPIVRIGHIAALPNEPVLTDRGYVKGGFLVEVHSIAGLSGSPVFWNVPPSKIVDGLLQIEQPVGHIPIGIFIGYHVIESSEDEMIVPQVQPAFSEDAKNKIKSTETDPRRTGFGVVLPIHYLFALFEGDAMQTAMKERVEQHRKASGFRPASLSSGVVRASLDNADSNLRHKEDFTSLLNAAAKTKPQDCQT